MRRTRALPHTIHKYARTTDGSILSRRRVAITSIALSRSPASQQAHTRSWYACSPVVTLRAFISANSPNARGSRAAVPQDLARQATNRAMTGGTQDDASMGMEGQQSPQREGSRVRQRHVPTPNDGAVCFARRRMLGSVVLGEELEGSLRLHRETERQTHTVKWSRDLDMQPQAHPQHVRKNKRIDSPSPTILQRA